MRLNVLGLSLIASLTSLGITSNSMPRYGPKTAVKNKYNKVLMNTSRMFDIGEIDLSPSASDYMYSPFCVKFKRKTRNPYLYITLDYVDKYGNTNYIYKDYDASLEYNQKLNTFFGEMKVDLNMLAEIVTFHAKVWIARSRDYVEFNFSINNPRQNNYVEKGKEKHIYTSFVKEYYEAFGRNYYCSYSFIEEEGFNYNLFYYNHFDIKKYLYYKADDPFSINDSMFYVFDPNTTLFNKVGINIPSFNNSYKFFPLIPVQGKDYYSYKFEFGTQYYVDPVTNMMSKTGEIGTMPTKSSIFMPLKHYKEFKTTTFGFLLDVDAYSLKYRLIYEFPITFEEHYYKNDFVIYKTIEKTTKDPSMKEITL